jgi:hypothetical protein
MYAGFKAWASSLRQRLHQEKLSMATASSPTCPAAPLPRTSSNCAPASTPALGQSFHRRVHPHRCPRTPHLAHVATGPGRCRSSSPSWRSPSSTWTTAYPSTTTSCGRWGSTGGALRSDRPAGVGPGPEKRWHGVSVLSCTTIHKGICNGSTLLSDTIFDPL